MKYTTANIVFVKGVALAVAAMYYVMDSAPYGRTQWMLVGFAAYLAIYALLRAVLTFDAIISYKRCMSLLSSCIISFLATRAIFFDEENVARDVLDGYQSYWAMMAINLEIGLYIADCLTITQDQMAITPLVVHHVLGVLLFSYSSLRQIMTMMTCYALLQEACNPFWYAHQLLYGWRSYRKPGMKIIFFANAIATVVIYIVVRFVLVKPNGVVTTYQCFFNCPQCYYFDMFYALFSLVALVCVNSLNLYKLIKSVIKAFSEHNLGPNDLTPPTTPVLTKSAKTIKSN